ncbi:unnamed protein product [Amoebophrya sp. A120]|nr:unnamed protein product [Amoebophrya sp. A120]|eukprot:GSA120T00017396001.1
MRYLYSLLLDDVPDLEIDEVTRVVKGLFRVPIVLTSIVDRKHQWFKSSIGLPLIGTTRQKSFCAHTLLSDVPEILYVPDARLDERFKYNPLVLSDPEIRFYCGCPIIVEGVRLGALCVIDYVPRVDITYEAALLLCNFADIVAASLGRGTARDEDLDMLCNACFLVDLRQENELEGQLYDHDVELDHNDLGDAAGATNNGTRTGHTGLSSHSTTGAEGLGGEKDQRRITSSVRLPDEFGKILYCNRVAKKLVASTRAEAQERTGSADEQKKVKLQMDPREMRALDEEAAGRRTAASAAASSSGSASAVAAEEAAREDPLAASPRLHLSDILGEVLNCKATRRAIFSISRPSEERGRALVFAGKLRDGSPVFCCWHPAACQARPQRKEENLSSVVYFPYTVNKTEKNLRDHAAAIDAQLQLEINQIRSDHREAEFATKVTEMEESLDFFAEQNFMPGAKKAARGFCVVKRYDPDATTSSPSKKKIKGVPEIKLNDEGGIIEISSLRQLEGLIIFGRRCYGDAAAAAKGGSMSALRSPSSSSVPTQGPQPEGNTSSPRHALNASSPQVALPIDHVEESPTTAHGGFDAHQLPGVVLDKRGDQVQDSDAALDRSQDANCAISSKTDLRNFLGALSSSAACSSTRGQCAANSNSGYKNRHTGDVDNIHYDDNPAPPPKEPLCALAPPTTPFNGSMTSEAGPPIIKAVLFCNTLCQACAMFHEFYYAASLAYRRRRVVFAEVDVDRSSALAKMVLGPTFFLPAVMFYDRYGNKILGPSVNQGKLCASGMEFRERLMALLVAEEESEKAELAELALSRNDRETVGDLDQEPTPLGKAPVADEDTDSEKDSTETLQRKWGHQMPLLRKKNAKKTSGVGSAAGAGVVASDIGSQPFPIVPATSTSAASSSGSAVIGHLNRSSSQSSSPGQDETPKGSRKFRGAGMSSLMPKALSNMKLPGKVPFCFRSTNGGNTNTTSDASASGLGRKAGPLCFRSGRQEGHDSTPLEDFVPNQQGDQSSSESDHSMGDDEEENRDCGIVMPNSKSGVIGNFTSGGNCSLANESALVEELAASIVGPEELLGYLGHVMVHANSAPSQAIWTSSLDRKHTSPQGSKKPVSTKPPPEVECLYEREVRILQMMQRLSRRDRRDLVRFAHANLAPFTCRGKAPVTTSAQDGSAPGHATEAEQEGRSKFQKMLQKADFLTRRQSQTPKQDHTRGLGTRVETSAESTFVLTGKFACRRKGLCCGMIMTRTPEH